MAGTKSPVRANADIAKRVTQTQTKSPSVGSERQPVNPRQTPAQSPWAK